MVAFATQYCCCVIMRVNLAIRVVELSKASIALIKIHYFGDSLLLLAVHITSRAHVTAAFKSRVKAI